MLGMKVYDAIEEPWVVGFTMTWGGRGCLREKKKRDHKGKLTAMDRGSYHRQMVVAYVCMVFGGFCKDFV